MEIRELFSFSHPSCFPPTGLWEWGHIGVAVGGASRPIHICDNRSQRLDTGYSVRSGLRQAEVPYVKLQGLQVWASERAQQEKGLAAKPGHLSSIPRTYMVKGENRLSQVVL